MIVRFIRVIKVSWINIIIRVIRVIWINIIIRVIRITIYCSAY
jgi:hypothetical protein